MSQSLKNIYTDKVIPELKKTFQYKNIHEVPCIEKVVLNCGFGSQVDRKVAAENVISDLGKITGQKAVATRAKNAISNFKLRIGDVIGAKVTLRSSRMWEFLDRFINIAAPTIRDFRGISPKSFDGRGNYNLGIKDHTIFPEIDLEKVTTNIGFDLTVVTSAKTDEEGRKLLSFLGFPFRK